MPDRDAAVRLVLAAAMVLAVRPPVLAQSAAPPAPEIGRTAPAPRAGPRPHRSQAPRQPITVYDARIEAGDLRISGSLRKGGVVVVLDDEIPVMADRNGRFLFKLPYRPRTCVATLKAGEDEREAVIANCAPEGETGPKGGPGPTGPQGVAGPQGEAGPQGTTGPQGAAGPQGVPGSAGPQGPAGPSGVAGAPGSQGEPGAAGDKGDTGAKGETGARGETGSGGAALRPLRADACPETGCELACEAGEALVSAYCLGGAGPSYRDRNGGVAAVCPGGSAGMAAFCAKPSATP